jgi:hypothetical protein
MVVYITTNLINGKKYIGKDKNNNPKYLGSGKAFKNAVKKYGRKNFQKEILCEAQDYKDMCELEIYYIAYYGADKSDLFYNITSGGDGGTTHDQEYKKVKVYQFDFEGNLVNEWKSAADAAKELNISRPKIVSACKSGKSCSKFLWSKESFYVNKKEITHKFNKPIYQYKEGVMIKKWDYLTQIEDELGFDGGNIQKCACSEHRSCYGYKWKYTEVC